MATQGRAFWIHQLVEYGIAAGLIMMAAQSSTPTVPVVLCLVLLSNAAITHGPLSAFKWINRGVHRIVDWLVVVASVVCAIFVDLDSRGRLALVALAMVMAIVTLGTNFASRTVGQRRLLRR
jgi:membrane-associated PAP2 superfamily phosphatase